MHARKKISLNLTCLASKVENFDLNEQKLCMKQPIEHTYIDYQIFFVGGGEELSLCACTLEKKGQIKRAPALTSTFFLSK